MQEFKSVTFCLSVFCVMFATVTKETPLPTFVAYTTVFYVNFVEF